MSLQSILSQLFPFLSTCSVCGQEHTGKYSFCRGCSERFLPLGWCCRTCANPLLSEDTLICPDCLKNPPYFEQVLCAHAYAAPLKQLILGFKYDNAIWHKSGLASLMLTSQQNLQDADWLLPVPSHNKRMRERGYNQVLLLTRILSKATNIPILKNAVIRQNGQHSQVGLSRRLRAENADGAFLWHSKNKAQGHIVIVDDLLTTGHTANALARVLKAAGAARVSVWTLARAVPQAHIDFGAARFASAGELT